MKETVLIVDDNANERIIAETLLRARGLRAVAAEDARSASDFLCGEGAAVVVLSLESHAPDGIELLHRLCGRFETRVLPIQPRVMVIIGPNDADLERTCTEAGADALVMRPWAPGHFLAGVERLLTVAAGGADAECCRSSDAALEQRCGS